MFNNPFGSFQDSVAAAKVEREQLDRLLTVSTPRERVLAAAIGLLSALLVAWFFFGNVADNLSVDAVIVKPGEDPQATGRSLHALAWMERDADSQIGAGLHVFVRLPDANGEIVALGGKIEEISSVPLSEQLAEFDLTAPISVHHIRIVLDENLEIEAHAGTECEIVIELGRQAPIALLRMG